VLVRWSIRIGTSLVGIAAGLLIATAALSGFSIGAEGFIEAVLLFWVTHIAIQFMALRVLIRQPSIALAGLLALASTVIALIIVNFVVSGLTISGASTYVFAALLVWVTTAIADTVGRRMIRDRREQGRARRREA
jgi:putative membrane protein